MWERLRSIWTVPDLRNKYFFTLGILLAFRVLANISVPLTPGRRVRARHPGRGPGPRCSTTTSHRRCTSGPSPRPTTRWLSGCSWPSRSSSAGWWTSQPGGPGRRPGPVPSRSCSSPPRGMCCAASGRWRPCSTGSARRSAWSRSRCWSAGPRPARRPTARRPAGTRWHTPANHR